MFVRFLRHTCRLPLLTASALALLASSPLHATTVSPVMVDLQTSGRGVVGSVSVTNTGAGPLPVEISIVALDATATGFDVGKGSTDDLLVAPPSALIPAGQTQSFRVQWVGDPELLKSKHYYVSINQLPVKLPAGQSAVQVVYDFKVLVSVASGDKKPALTIRSVAPALAEGKPAAALTVENTGAAHGYLSQHRIKFSETNAAGVVIYSKTISGAEFQQSVGYGLVASGQTRTITVPLDPTMPKGGTLAAVLMDERGQ